MNPWPERDCTSGLVTQSEFSRSGTILESYPLNRAKNVSTRDTVLPGMPNGIPVLKPKKGAFSMLTDEIKNRDLNLQIQDRNEKVAVLNHQGDLYEAVRVMMAESPRLSFSVQLRALSEKVSELLQEGHLDRAIWTMKSESSRLTESARQEATIRGWLDVIPALIRTSEIVKDFDLSCPLAFEGLCMRVNGEST